MALLVIDTSSSNCAVFAKRADGVSHQKTDVIGRGHAECLIAMIDDVLDQLGLAYADLTRLGVTVGPGSFTGVRVGVSAIRGLALALEIPAIGVSTLQALQAEIMDTGHRLVLIDAKRQEFYAELFGPSGTSVGGAMLIKENDDFPASWLELERLCLIGSGAPNFVDRLSNATLISDMAAPDIATVARLVENTDETSQKPKPLYLRKPDAKPQSKAKLVERVVS